ncbi:MAG: hypothetical protein BAJATHORv1_20045 [Candidatus Thorarchaeota archaeon]|nr:MAG: hypothetical protein BAJATHORv1_20045 [Candidatus Thorarchaeota archaeon]
MMVMSVLSEITVLGCALTNGIIAKRIRAVTVRNNKRVFGILLTYAECVTITNPYIRLFEIRKKELLIYWFSFLKCIRINFGKIR